uniref:MEIOB-like N-terminal domain-containing protein n=1 Tax=Astatotilapia calliptera TaxID=8154 RepID=A0A3P8Q430_ASTCA
VINKMAAHTYIAISELHPNISHSKVAGIIIGKTDVKSFPDRKNIGMDRFTFGFTVKDSPDFFINVSTWGNDAYVNGLASSFNIGDCVTIENPLVATKDLEKGDRFCPATPSHYRLLVTEAHSQVCLCADMDTIDRLLPLIHLPVKDSRDFYSLGDIVANGQKLDGSVINILAAVKSIGDTKQFTTSDGRRGQRLEVRLFDDSVLSFPLMVFCCFNCFSSFQVLFIADAKISFDSFRSGMVATVNSKSIITVNPGVPKKVPFKYTCMLLFWSAVESITDVYTVSQLMQKARENPEALFGITYSFISKLDLDSSASKVIKTRCSKCKFLVTEDLNSCTNQLCPGKGQIVSATTGFDLLVDFTDHTGTLHACSLRSPVAEKALGCTVKEFISLTDGERTAMKWKFLLERCKIYVKIIPSPKMKSGIRGMVLDCSLADPGEVKQHMSALLQQRL